MQAHEPGLFFRLYHGRTSPDEEMEQWGTDGPTFGPLKYVHAAYFSTMQIGFEDGERVSLPIVGDLILWDGVYYGDFEVLTTTKRNVRGRLIQWWKGDWCW
ncbi:MAG TPA: hypothetical protein VM557_11110 [Thermoanaerobaculia bacterium]|nr:hypothetical protein [Thermoanaerobaculia bacterium]